GYDRRQQRWIIGTLVAATVVGLADGYARIWSGRSRDGTLELHSVGHVNHTAIYLAVMFGVCAAWIFTRWRAWRAGTRTVAAAVAALILGSLVVTASRGAIGIALAMLPLLAVAWWPRSRVPMAVSGAVVAVVALAIVAGGAEVIRKHWQYVEKQNVLSFREGIWRTAIA